MTYQPTNDLEFVLGARNLMNRQPPYAQNDRWLSAWDPANGGNLEGRVVSGQVRLAF